MHIRFSNQVCIYYCDAYYMTYAGTPYAKILPMRERGLEMIVICTTVLRRYVDPSMTVYNTDYR